MVCPPRPTTRGRGSGSGAEGFETSPHLPQFGQDVTEGRLGAFLGLLYVLEPTDGEGRADAVTTPRLTPAPMTAQAAEARRLFASARRHRGDPESRDPRVARRLLRQR